MRANHNALRMDLWLLIAVSSYAKLLKWEQITTSLVPSAGLLCCKFLCKVTKMRANHNGPAVILFIIMAVSSYAKLLKWEQITTIVRKGATHISCKFLCKVTKMRANHNPFVNICSIILAVSSYAKLLKWEQITTFTTRFCLPVTL